MSTQNPLPVNATAKRQIVLNLILDESGSMQDCREKTVEGLNEYLGGLIDDPNADYLVTFTKFDAHPGDPTCRVIHKLVGIKAMGPISLDSYVPRGSTPLLDAIGGTVRTVEKEIGDQSVVTVIVTDGFENASREWNNQKIKDLIAEKEKTGKWTFVYLGADVDAFAGAGAIGVSAGNAMSYAKAATPDMFRSMGHAMYARSAILAASGGTVGATRCYFEDASIDNRTVMQPKVPPTVANARQAGRARADKQTAEERSALAQKAARARWDKSRT